MIKLNFTLILLLCIVMSFTCSCKKDSVKPETGKEQKTSANSPKDSIVPKKDNAVTGKEVQLTPAEQKKLNIFFSNFSEVYLEPFARGSITDDELIKFGVLHNHINNLKLFQKAGNGNLKLKEEAVSKTIGKYFGITFTGHKATTDIKYNGGYYFIPESDGEAYTFSQAEKVTDIGGDRYTAYINVYTASSGWTGNANANPKSWGTDSNEKPELTGKFKATFSKTNGPNGESVYNLIDYIKQ